MNSTMTQEEMSPPPETVPQGGRLQPLKNKVAIITGGDSGIGQAVSILFAHEGGHIAVIYNKETADAEKTQHLVEREGGKCSIFKGDVADKQWCEDTVQKVYDTFGTVNILVNNAAEQHPQDDIRNITEEQLKQTFETNIFGYFYMAQAALKYFNQGDTIINTTSVTAYRGSEQLIDYSATKGAIVSFTRSLALQLAPKRIRVNAVAPGPVWTPLVAATFSQEKLATFGKNTFMGRAAQPTEIAPSFLFLATNDSLYMTGQVLHPNGGEVINT